MKFVKIENTEDNMYSIYFTDKFYEYAAPLYKNESYFNICYRLFGMLPQDFYHYIGVVYHAVFIPCTFLRDFIYTRFKTKRDAEVFALEIERRLNYFIARGDFS